MSEPDIDPMENEDPEAMLEEDDERPLMSSFSIASGDDDKKPPSLWPRNYNGRRRLVIAGLCFLFAVGVLIKNSGK
jgi:hypothetical protein